MVYNHYHNKLGLPTPNTEAVFSGWFQYRTEDYGLMQAIGFGTHLHIGNWSRPQCR
jgi:hypothetical protein